MMNTPANDPIVAEVRAVREARAVQFGYDLRAIFRDLQERQRKSGRKYVRYAARPATAEKDRASK